MKLKKKQKIMKSIFRISAKNGLFKRRKIIKEKIGY